MKKTYISILLVIAMLLTMIPWSLAEEEAPEPGAPATVLSQDEPEGTAEDASEASEEDGTSKAEPEAEPVEEPAVDPEAEPEAEPAVDPEAEPTDDPADEPKTDPDESSEPTDEPTDPAEPEAESAEEPAVDPEVDPEEAAAEDGLPVIGEMYTYIAQDEDIPQDNDALLTRYVSDMFRSGDPEHVPSPYSKSLPDPQEVLTESEYKMERALKKVIHSIASGTRGNTEFSIELPDIHLNFESACGMNMNRVFHTLFLDCTYELYWFGRQVAWGFTSETKMVFQFSVADDYASETATLWVKSSAVQAAKAAVKKTGAIIEAYEDLSDIEKLRAYKNEICRLTEYNMEAATTDQYAGQEGPWNLVWVFDGDPDTNVVCEGYAKAFEYLCNHSTFRSKQINCYCASGDAVFPNGAEGPHMWNIVKLDDGRNYVVDATNCDTGDTGDDSFFLCCAVDGDPQGGYTLSSGSFFGYDATTLAACSNRSRTLATSPYYGAASGVSVTENPRRIRVVEGQEATFSVTASGNGLSYQWYCLPSYRQGWQKVSGATSPTVTVTAQGDMDLTPYYCLVTGSDGRCASESAVLEVVVAPTITKQPGEVLAISSNMPIVSVEAVGTYLNYQWYSRRDADSEWKKESYVGGGGLIITGQGPAFEYPGWGSSVDGLQLYCEVSNEAGSVNSDIATVTVVKTPKVVSQPADAAVLPGETAAFQTVFEGRRLNYQWQQWTADGWTSIEGATDNSFSVVATADMDGLAYHCTVTNEAGQEKSSVAHLYVVTAPPVITTQPQDYTLKQTSYGTITGYASLSAEGRGLSYQWYRFDGENEYAIEDATSASLRISTDDPYLDDNQVWCVVSNPLGSVTSDRATVSIYLRPAVTEQPQDAVVASGETATFSVSGTGKELTYQWYVNEGSGAVAIEGATGPTYSLVAAHEQHGATYYCVLRNPAAAVQSDAALLIVDHVPAEAVQENEEAATCVTKGGYDEVLYCSDCGLELKRTRVTTPKDPENHRYKKRRLEKSQQSTCVTEGYETYHVYCSECYKNLGDETVTLPLSTEHTRDGGARENYIPATAESRGSADYVHYCQYCGVEMDREHRVYRKHVPGVFDSYLSILEEPQDATAGTGENVVFLIKGLGVDGFKLQWYTRTTPEDEWVKLKGKTSSKLTVKTTAALNGVQYRCYVYNKYGTVYSDIVTLTVELHPPVVTQQPEDTTVDSGGTATFTAAAQGNKVKYQWYCRTAPEAEWTKVKSATKATLTVKKVKPEYEGWAYRCEAYNDDGAVFSEAATLTVVLHPPVITSQPSDISADNGTAAVFTVAAQGKSLKYQWYCRTAPDEEWTKVKSATKATLKLSKVKPENDGCSYRCDVYNGDGHVWTEEAALTVALHPPVIAQQPEDVIADAGAAAAFTVTATGKSLKYQWYYRTAPDGEWTKVKSATKATLKLSKVKAEQNGWEYRCDVYNADGSVLSEIVALTVQ